MIIERTMVYSLYAPYSIYFRMVIGMNVSNHTFRYPASPEPLPFFWRSPTEAHLHLAKPVFFAGSLYCLSVL